MSITCCYNCEKRHEKCHAHCEEYLTQKILKIVGDATADKEYRIGVGIDRQRYRQMAKMRHLKHIRRQK